MVIGAISAVGLIGCDENFDDADLGEVQFKEDPEEILPGKEIDPKNLPFVDPIEAAEVFIQRLPESTEAGENVAVHVRLPEPENKDLDGSLVRVVGDPENPMMLVSSDALRELGVIKESPGKGFFTTFATLSDKEIEQRLATEKSLSTDKEGTKEQIIFEGRQPIAITTGIAFDINVFQSGLPVALGPCPIMPLSVLARWEEALIITDLGVVRDPTRTNDQCHPGADNPNGVWTFKHLMTQMSLGSGLTPHDFVVKWLSTWLNDQLINGDTVPRRNQMYFQVIQPWAAASGITSSFNPLTGVLTLNGQLNLNKAPFRLSAIVNRIDLGATSTGSPYNGGGMPTDAGELRFVFGVQNASTCQQLPFSVIFEYGVPRKTCATIKDWANQWIKLSNAAVLPRFSATWRAHLQTLTQSVVLAGAAPTKGNTNAINQIRTNENALNGQWELREFTLSTENLVGPDTPVNGPLRTHTVALTPDDTVYDEIIDFFLDNWALFTPTVSGPGTVRSTVPAGAFFGGTPTIVNRCSANYKMPLQFAGQPLRGGNAFVAPVNAWQLDSANSADPRDVCAREQFSLNTCNGCHLADTGTSFFHVNPQTAPAALSNFMTGGGTGLWSVPDQQWGPGVASMQFNDLNRRHSRLYGIACTQCGGRLVFPALLDHIAEVAGVVPVDVFPTDDNPIKVGGIFDMSTVKQLLSVIKPGKDAVVQDLELDKFTGTDEMFVH